jgi:hypothetical protein
MQHGPFCGSDFELGLRVEDSFGKGKTDVTKAKGGFYPFLRGVFKFVPLVALDVAHGFLIFRCFDGLVQHVR